ncbi:MAG: hypothetical protein IANPNBLG_01892 [Bryobacteraceae bacterium]|nr:hypothetical protein [Bryobacteraceae bacterium]
MRRREFLGTIAAAPALGADGRRKKIACLSSTYHVRSHSDNFITRFLEGYWIDTKYYPPPFEVASLWTDQIHPADIGGRLAQAYGVRVASSIEDALTLGTGKLAVDGVVLVCEHGNYPFNDRQQQLYPRYEFFEQVVNVFRSSGRSCPVFSDKHLSYDWKKAKRMYDWSRELHFPFMAGSSVSVTFRRPEVDPPLGVEMESALCVGGGWVADGGIFHLLDTLQAFVERRKGAETGVKAVRMMTGDAVWKAAAEGLWKRELLDAALSRGEKVAPGRPEDGKSAVVGIVEYRDGFQAAVLALGSKVNEYLMAYKARGKVESTLCYVPSENSNNFSMLVHGITQMIRTGKPSHPVERTLLVSGVLSELMESRYQQEKRLETPELAVSYKAPAKSWYAHGMGS